MTPERWRQITGIFQDALAHETGQRHAFVGQACGDDLALRHAVDKLLNAHHNAGQFGETPLGAPAPPLEPGTPVGPYRIVQLLGAGGMGEVYRAHDAKLRRDVAIKVLPQIFSADPARRARFEREAQLLASLNHPHIAAVYGSEESDGVQALVMELVEGEDLAERIARGPIPLADALPLAAQMAEALEAAHEQGIIHRDLKPANIKVREDGTVKVLDFGLAKVLEPMSSSTADVGNSPTMSGLATHAGFILGTAAYMSPEQARGKAVDKRADIWAFGVVLYEMLTGRPLYAGKTAAEILAGVIEREPDASALPAVTPPSIRELLARCLTKDPHHRLQAIGEARIAIDRALRQPHPPPLDGASGRSPGGAADAAGARVQRRARLAWTIAAVAMAGIGVLAVPAIRYFGAAQVDRQKETWQIVTPPTSHTGSFAISPDGLRLVFSATIAGKVQLWIQPLSALTAQPLPGTEGGTFPFWRPDSQAIGFFADNKLKWIHAAGGPTTTLATVQHAWGGSWNQNGDILFSRHLTEELWRVSSSSGSEPVQVTRLLSSQSGHVYPWFLPDGRHFLYWATGSTEGRGVYLASLDAPEGRRLIDDASAAVYAPPGFLLFTRQSSLHAQRFDLETLKLTGQTFVVAEPPSYNGGDFRCSAATGTLVYRDGSGSERQLAWVDRAGKIVGLVGEPYASSSLGMDLSPDGTRLAVSRTAEGNMDVLLLETARFGATRLTDDQAGDFYPVWSGDGQRVAFTSTRQTGVMQIWETAATGAGVDTLLLASPGPLLSPQDWSRDGRFLLYIRVDPGRGADLWALPMTNPGDPFPIVNTVFMERGGQFSPDGKWVAYSSNRLGRTEIYVQPFPGPGGVTSVSTSGGTLPRWSIGSKELFYIGLDDWMMSVPILGSDGQSMRLGAPARLFASRMAYRNIEHTFLYSVANDGQRFLVEQINERGTATLTVVRDWQAAIKATR